MRIQLSLTLSLARRSMAMGTPLLNSPSLSKPVNLLVPRASLLTLTQTPINYTNTSNLMNFFNRHSVSTYQQSAALHIQWLQTNLFHTTTRSDASTSSSSAHIKPQQDQQPLPSDTNYSYPSTQESISQQPQEQLSSHFEHGYTGYHIPRHLVSTSHEIPPHRIAGVIGLVQGNTVRVRNVARDYFASIRALFGGELRTYTDLMKEAREEAIDRMIEDAVQSGGNAIVSVRITTSAIASNASELTAYGTAVILENGYDELGEDEFNNIDSFDNTSSPSASFSRSRSSSPTLGGDGKIDKAAETARGAETYDVYKPKT